MTEKFIPQEMPGGTDGYKPFTDSFFGPGSTPFVEVFIGGQHMLASRETLQAPLIRKASEDALGIVREDYEFGTRRVVLDIG